MTTTAPRIAPQQAVHHCVDEDRELCSETPAVVPQRECLPKSRHLAALCRALFVRRRSAGSPLPGCHVSGKRGEVNQRCERHLHGVNIFRLEQLHGVDHEHAGCSALLTCRTDAINTKADCFLSARVWGGFILKSCRLSNVQKGVSCTPGASDVSWSKSLTLLVVIL